MNYEPGWAWQPEKCPCDRDFIEWYKERGLTIFHMGTGLHHKVGLELSDYNDVVGLTYSPDELTAYTKLIEHDWTLQAGYAVLFGDIAHLNLRLLQKFDIVTLFHVGEIVTSSLQISLVLERFKRHLAPDGLILAYSGSAAAPEVLPYFEKQLEFDSEFKSLRIYRKQP